MARGARAIVVGLFRTRTWRDQDGVERSRLEVVAEEIGASLRWATAHITKANTSG
jgi:single-strand DNA-binding protein